MLRIWRNGAVSLMVLLLMAGDLSLFVVSPATGEKAFFRWSPCKTGEVKDDNSEIVDVISWIVEDVDELSSDQELLGIVKNVDRSSLPAVSDLCSMYNKLILQHIAEWTECGVKPTFMNRKASKSHIQFILYQCYNRAVAEPDKLNQYPPFSPQVYGETSFELIAQMIDTVDISNDDSFIDLGSGVGQVVLQVAACSDAKFCYGIEKAEYPAVCACKLDSEFRYWMDFYGKRYRPYHLERGDFLAAEYQERISSAGVLFANNFAFGPEVDHQLKQRFANLKEGARIISSKAFCPLNFRITDRNLGDIGSIMRVSCLNPIQDAVSWTDKPFSYYVHTIDRSLLERYFSRLKNPKLKDDTELIRRDRKGRIISDQVSKDVNHTNNVNGTSDTSEQNTVGRRPCIWRLNGLRTTLSSTNRHRRCKSVGSTTDRSGELNGRGLHPKGVGHRIKSSRSRRHSQNRLSRCEKAKRSLSRRSDNALDQNKNEQQLVHALDETVSERLESLAFTSEEQSDGLLRSSSFPALGIFPPSGSGQTTPTGSTSISSAAFSNDDCPLTLSGLYVESEKPRLQQQQNCASTGSYRSNPVPQNSFSPRSCSDSSSIVTSSPLDRLPLITSDDVRSTPALNSCTSHQSSSMPLRITLSLSRGKLDDSDEIGTTIMDETLTANHSINLQSDSSVANRRALRKCRQSLRSDNDNTCTFNPSAKLVRSLRRSGLRKSQRLTDRDHKRTTGRRGERVVEKGEMRQHLDVLHQETLAQTHKKPISANRDLGCNEPLMSLYTCHYQPHELRSLESATKHAIATSSDPCTGHSNEVVPLALTQYLELTKRVFMDHMATVRSPAYASNVRRQLEFEQARHAELLQLTRSAEQAITELHATGTELLRRFTKRLGILISTPSAFFSQARKLIKHHHALEAKIAEFRKQIAELSAANQELVRRHQAEAARLLSSAIQSTNSATLLPHLHRTTTLHRSPGGHNLSDRVCTVWGPSVESPILVRTLTDIPPPPPLTKTCNPAKPHHSNTLSNGRLQSQKATRHQRSIPLLLPQTAMKQCSSLASSDDQPPPILHRLHERSEKSSIPPPPPLLPMHNLPLSNVACTALHGVCHSASQSDGTNGLRPVNGHCTSVFQHKQCKSMHASLQDLITHEFCKQSVQSEQTLQSPAHQKSHTQYHFALPPRKRSWDTVGSDHSIVKKKKYARNGSPGMHVDSVHTSPPALSPIEPRVQVGIFDSDLPPHQPVSHMANSSLSSTISVPPPPLLYSPDPHYCSTPVLGHTNLVTPPVLPPLPFVVAQALGQ